MKNIIRKLCLWIESIVLYYKRILQKSGYCEKYYKKDYIYCCRQEEYYR